MKKNSNKTQLLHWNQHKQKTRRNNSMGFEYPFSFKTKHQSVYQYITLIVKRTAVRAQLLFCIPQDPPRVHYFYIPFLTEDPTECKSIPRYFLQSPALTI